MQIAAAVVLILELSAAHEIARMALIFISYRRVDASGYAGRLYDRLSIHFGDQLFRDTEQLRPGDDWVSALERAVESSDVLLALISADWVEQRDERGRRRIENDNDWVRIELATALRRGIQVIPVLLPGASPLAPERLPEDLKALAALPAQQFAADRWESEVEEIIKRLEAKGIGRNIAPINVSSCKHLRLLHTLKGHNAGVFGVAFSPDGFTIASCGGQQWDFLPFHLPEEEWEEVKRGDPTIRLWRTVDGALIRVLREGSIWASDVTFSPDGTIVAAGYGDGRLVLWSANSGELQYVLDAHDSVNEISFSPDSQTLASGGSDGVIRLWRVADGAPLWTIAEFQTPVIGVAFAPGGSSLVAVADYVCNLLSADTGAHIARLRPPSQGEWRRRYICAAAFARDGRTIAGGDEAGIIYRWRLPRGELDAMLTPPKMAGGTDRVNSVGFSYGGDLLAIGHHSGTVRFWDSAVGTLAYELCAARADIKDLAFSPDGTMLAAGSCDAAVRIWRI